MKPLFLHRLCWVLGGLALVLGLLRGSMFGNRLGAPLITSNSGWVEGGFGSNRPYPSTTQGVLARGLATAGSWLNGDDWIGDCATVWMPLSVNRVRVCVAGYPQHHDCKLSAEFRFSDGTIIRKDCNISDPRETWSPWDFRRPYGAVALRIVAEDHATDAGGWLAFSEPTLVPQQAFGAIYMLAQILSTLALALSLIWTPGYFWSVRAILPEFRIARLIAAGPLSLAAIGLLIWLFDGAVKANILGFVLVTVLWAAIGKVVWRRRVDVDSLSENVTKALTISAILALACVAKASFSGGPEGELYGGSIFRTLEVSDRSDPRIPFHVVQATAYHLGAASPEMERYFVPWTFFSRGPLAGLIALPVTLATAGMPPRDTETRVWQPFDTTGFASYRIVLIVLASSVIIALFGVLTCVVGEKWAIVGSGILTLTPFVIHETFFTWPKSVSTTWILLSFLLAHTRKPLRGGIALGVGFLFHPMAALWAPWLIAWTVFRGGSTQRLSAVGGLKFAFGLCLLLTPWMMAGKFAPHLPDSWRAGQGSFIEYFRLAEYEQHPSVAKWCKTRWMNFSNTFLPFWLFLINRNHPVLNSVYGPSNLLVKFAFGWWNTLPMGTGLLLWATAFRAIASNFKLMWCPGLLFVIAPGLFLTAYWGASSTGLMRECGHPLLVALVGISTASAALRGNGWATTLIGHRLFPWLQLPEAALMLWLTTMCNPHQPGADYTTLDALYVCLNISSLVLIAWLLSTWRLAEEPVRAKHI